ncbi:MAG: rhomboid family intramembrane serine protease [Nanoarchaeota archaeon]|nr:rhomboid family intramembrane serine protease [Nanoarchaeota archaeon]MBU0977663.1 rhomboid family intramembrane serine protease [Nanoarchaeota archaeon]
MKKFKFYAVKLSLLMILIFTIQLLSSGFTDALVLNQQSWSQPWRFLTAIFIHGGIAHLVLNLFALLLFGSILERLINSNRFLLVFLTTGILANLIAVNFYSSSLGASGAIFGILGTLIIIRPLMPVWAFGLPMPIFVAGIIWALADLLGAYGFFTGNPLNNTGNIAHLSGMLFGILFGLLYRKQFIRKKRISVSIDEHEVRNWERTWMRN